MNEIHLTLLVLFPVLLLTGIPIYVALGIIGFVVTFLSGNPLDFASQSILNGLDNFPLLAIPAFILAGNIMERGGITNDIIRIFRHSFGCLWDVILFDHNKYPLNGYIQDHISPAV